MTGTVPPQQQGKGRDDMESGRQNENLLDDRDTRS